MTKQSRQVAVILGVVLALVPLLLFAYLGLHSRLMLDDYIHLGLARDIGVWNAMQVLREIWNGDYSNFLLYGLLARLGTVAPALFALFLCASAFVGYTWLANTVLACLGIRRRRRAASVVLAALATAAAINGFHHAQVFYWLTASVEYSWPAVMLLLGIAFATATAHRLQSRTELILAVFAATLYAFANAGFSELYLIFQLTAVTLINVYVFIFQHGPKRKTYVILAVAGLLGTMASLPVQLSTPGVTLRSSLSVVAGTPIFPARHLPDLLDRTLGPMVEYIGLEASFAGFMLVAFSGLFITLSVGNSAPVDSKPWQTSFANAPIAFALVVQFLFIPVLWSHQSDNLQVLGRFSFSFLFVVCANLSAILLSLALLWRRDLLENALKRQNGLMIYCLCILLLVSLLFAVTQVRSIHYKAASYLFATALSTLIMLTWQLTCMADEPRLRGLFRMSAFAAAGAVITLAALIGVKLWGAGYIVERALASATYALMLAGLMNGVTLGALIRLGFDTKNADAYWLQWLRLLSLLVALAIAAGMVIGQGQRISHARRAAEIWDANHVEITRLRDEGDPTVHTKRFPSLIHRSLNAIPYRYKNERLAWEPLVYYGLFDDGEAFYNCRCSNEIMPIGEEAPTCAQIICLAYGLSEGD